MAPHGCESMTQRSPGPSYPADLHSALLWPKPPLAHVAFGGGGQITVFLSDD